MSDLAGRARLFALASAALLCAGCGQDASPCAYAYPAADWRPRALDLQRAENESATPGVVEVSLRASAGVTEFLAGRSTPAWHYNGSVPGPLIEAKVGDRLVVHFTNDLSEATTIHWHGLHLPAAMDGSTLARDPVWPGDSFTYEFDLNAPGLYWYHPHAHETAQLMRGLYGAVVVRGETPLAVPERIFMLQDVMIDAQGTLVPDEAYIERGDGYRPATSVHTHEMMGREGSVVAINGKVFPSITVRAGTWERWRLVNASNARYYPLRLDGHALVQIGSDAGLLEAPLLNPSLVLTPGERIDLLVYFSGAPGSAALFYADANTRRRGNGTTRPRMDLLQIVYGNEPAPAAPPPMPVPASLRTIERLDPSAPLKSFILRETILQGTVGHDHVTTPTSCQAQLNYPGLYAFSINGELWPDVTPTRGVLGETQVWEISNQSQMDHPFHLHGFSFQPLMLDGVPYPLQWKDTINVPSSSTLRLAVRFLDFTGAYLYHCHIIEHGAEGMMGELIVSAPNP